MQVSIAEAQNGFLELFQAVEAGKRVFITLNGSAVAELMQAAPTVPKAWLDAGADRAKPSLLSGRGTPIEGLACCMPEPDAFVSSQCVPRYYRGTEMAFQLSIDQKALVRQAIDSGRLQHEDDALNEALSLWEERERRRFEIIAALDEAEASVARGEGRPVTEESMRELAESVKRRGRMRLAAEVQSSL